jgi:hypothetical protein
VAKVAERCAALQSFVGKVGNRLQVNSKLGAPVRGPMRLTSCVLMVVLLFVPRLAEAQRALPSRFVSQSSSAAAAVWSPGDDLPAYCEHSPARVLITGLVSGALGTALVLIVASPVLAAGAGDGKRNATPFIVGGVAVGTILSVRAHRRRCS